MTTLRYILIWVLGLVIGLFTMGLYMKKVSIIDVPDVMHDTIVRTDTLIQERVKWKYKTFTDTTFIIYHDTVIDTLTVYIPIDHYQYSDSIITDTARIHLNIKYQGYKAKLDTVQLDYTLFPQTITKVKKSGWGPSIVIGAGLGTGATINYTPYNQQPLKFGDIHAGVYLVIGWGYHW